MLQTPAKLLPAKMQFVNCASDNCSKTTPLLLWLHDVELMETFPALSTPAPPHSNMEES
jgi:hypothetical protein